MNTYTYIDPCGRLMFHDAGWTLQVTGAGQDGWELRLKK
jgi:hypothetical protein